MIRVSINASLSLWWVVVIVCMPTFVHAAPRGRVTCNDDGRILKVAKITRRANRLARVAKRRGVHILDLGEDAREVREALDVARNEKDWCALHEHTVALRAMIASANVRETEFLRKKAARVDAWVQGSINKPRKKKRAKRLLGRASNDLARSRLRVGNTKLNQVLSILTGSRNFLQLPKAPLVIGTPAEPVSRKETRPRSAAPVSGVLSRSLAIESCPELEDGTPTRKKVLSRLAQLRSDMAKKRSRSVDFKYGPELFEIMMQEGTEGDLDRTATAACVLLTRLAEQMEIGLGSVMGRFRRVNSLRDSGAVGVEEEGRFATLVRKATTEIERRELDDAYATLDELLVLLGDPVDESSQIP